MRSFIKNTKGAVTVFVTLLLIPAILVSGTAVDLSRIHTARSILQDANQMAANSVLTQYDALLYDLYGLFGVAKDDPILGELLDTYVSVTVFGEETGASHPGTLQLFSGDGLTLDGPNFAEDKDLGNPDVLRRQIEEYMKFRGPVILVKNIIEALEGNKLKEDTALIKDKLAIEEGMAKLYDKYKELYNAIIAADKCNQAIGGIAGGSFAAVSSSLTNLRDYFIDLETFYESWELTDETECPEIKNEYAAYYRALLRNVAVLTTGGQKGYSWYDGRWELYSSVIGLNQTIENAKIQADNFKVKFDEVVNIARELDAMHDELSRNVDDLERKLNNGECGEDLKKALTDKTGSPPMTVVERYRDVLQWDNIEGMASVNQNGGYSYIDNSVKPLLDGVKYRNANDAGAGSLSRAELAAIAISSGFALKDSVSAADSRAAQFAKFPADSVTYKMPPGFLKFAEYPGRNKPFFEALSAMVNQPQFDPVKIFEGQQDEGGENTKEKQKNLIDSLLKIVQTAINGLKNEPLGAEYINDSEIPPPEKMSLIDIAEMIPKALSEPVIGVITDPLGSLGKTGDYLLLLTYCTSMFSNYSDTKPESVGKTKEQLEQINFTKSISGVPISPEVNYFYQSEWEYLYKGSNNAGTNLSAVTRLIFMIRLVCNYITVFSVNEITSIVTSIQAAFAWCPPLGVVLGELARGAFVAAESVVDVSALRSGHKVKLFKNVLNGEWLCSPSGVKTALQTIISESAIGTNTPGNEESTQEKGLTYSQYMLFLLISKAVVYLGDAPDAATELAQRTGNLIEWNVVNYRNGINADEEKMADALTNEDRFRLADMKTDFSLTTTAELRMMFLSMPFSQKFSLSRGFIAPSSILIGVTDYRGY